MQDIASKTVFTDFVISILQQMAGSGGLGLGIRIWNILPIEDFKFILHGKCFKTKENGWLIKLLSKTQTTVR